MCYVYYVVPFHKHNNVYNLFLLVLMEGRKYSHDSVDVTGINVMLNTKDVSEYLKISPNGLEVDISCYIISFSNVMSVLL